MRILCGIYLRYSIIRFVMAKSCSSNKSCQCFTKSRAIAKFVNATNGSILGITERSVQGIPGSGTGGLHWAQANWTKKSLSSRPIQ